MFESSGGLILLIIIAVFLFLIARVLWRLGSKDRRRD